jgi:hypothetical protein
MPFSSTWTAFFISRLPGSSPAHTADCQTLSSGRRTVVFGNDQHRGGVPVGTRAVAGLDVGQVDLTKIATTKRQCRSRHHGRYRVPCNRASCASGD